MTSQVQSSPDEYLTQAQVREILKCTGRTLYRRRLDKTLPAIAINSRRYLYRKSAVLKFLKDAEAGNLRTFTDALAQIAEEPSKAAISEAAKKVPRPSTGRARKEVK